MSCPYCQLSSVSSRKHRISLGYRTFYCRDCKKRFNERTGSPFNDLQFPTDIVLLAVLWRLRYTICVRPNYRPITAINIEHGAGGCHIGVRAGD